MVGNRAIRENESENPVLAVKVDETMFRGTGLEEMLRKLMKEQADSGVGSWFQALFAVGSSLGAFFAGFTLSIVASTANFDDPGDSDATSSSDAARNAEAGRFAATSSLLFVVTVLVCSACGLAFAFNRESIDRKMKAHKEG